MASPSTEVVANARVSVTVEVTGLGPFGPDWKIDAIHRDAARSAKQAIENMIRGCREHENTDHSHRVQIIGEPEVKVVMTERKKP